MSLIAVTFQTDLHGSVYRAYITVCAPHLRRKEQVVQNIEDRIKNIEKNQKAILSVLQSNSSPYYTIETLASALNRSKAWMYKNKHLFASAIRVIDPNSSAILFHKKTVHKIIENNSDMFKTKEAV